MNTTNTIITSGLLAATLAACSASGPSTQDPPTCTAATPRAGATIVVNELMAVNAATVEDETGARSDWAELYNYGDADVSLCGYSMTDDLGKPAKGFLGPDAVIPPGGYLVVWFSGIDDPDLSHHMPFKLARTGALGLADAEGQFVARLTYGRQSTDFSAAREPDGSDRWAIEWHPSPGASNPAGDGAPLPPHDPTAEPETVPAAPDMSERIMGYDVLLEIGLRIEPDQIARLEAEPREYVPGYLLYDGREYGPVGVRLKGQNSFQTIHEKPSFRINIDEYVDHAKFFDMDDLTLNNMDGDFSMMHERLAYMIARQVGPASRANHAVVTVNDKLYGLYTNVEPVKHHMVARWFEDSQGPLFEATDVDFAAQYIDAFEHESGPDDRSKLSALAAALTNPDPDAALAAARAHVDLDGFLAYWAMTAVVGQFDAFPYSNPGDDYFVYVDPVTDKLWFMPWGMDETFYSGSYDVNQVTSRLATTCLASPACYQSFVNRVWSVLAMTEDLDLIAERERVAAQIAAHVSADRRKPYTDAEVSEFQMQLYWFISGRRANLEAMLGPEPQ